jgi:hypothetical protein
MKLRALLLWWVVAVSAPAFADGARLEIEWDKTWYPGSVVQSALGLLLVHYDGYTKADEEWVPLQRVRAAK